ncbi:MAG: transposase [Phycisphaerales bacterium]|nr:transposase [Phycisphaerales bacterium]
MPRVARIVIPDCPHHVTQRGNNCQDVFFVDDDRRAYLEILAEQSQKFGVAVQGYCLMTNHIHLIVTPRAPESLALAIGRTHWVYAQYINRFHNRSGHLWQNRFHSCGLDAKHFRSAMIYVERNPVRAKMSRTAVSYPWSSAAAHCGKKDTSNMLDMDTWRRICRDAGDWPRILAADDDKAVGDKLRIWTSSGRPLGGDSFVSKLEKTLGRRLRPLPVGRPRKTKETTKTTKKSKTKQ